MAFFIQAYLIVVRFLRNDIIVGVELKFENIPFPSVTVCNNNPFKNSLARTMGPVRDTVRFYNFINDFFKLQAFDNAIEKSSIKQRSRRTLGHKIYEKIYDENFGLLAVYSFCQCENDSFDCKATKVFFYTVGHPSTLPANIFQAYNTEHILQFILKKRTFLLILAPLQILKKLAYTFFL